MQSRTLYSSTKFVALREPENTTKRRRNYTLWVIIVIVIIIILLLSCNSSISHHLRKFIDGAYFVTDDVNNKSDFERSISIPKIWVDENLKTPKDFCHESLNLEAIPAEIIAKIKNKNDVESYITMALLLHVKFLIKNHNVEYLRTTFNEFNRKLMSVEKFEHFADFLKNLNSNQVKFSLKFLQPGMEVGNFGIYFAVVEELRTWYNYLHLLGEFLSTYEQQKSREFFVKVTEVNFYKFTTETQSKLSRFVYSFNLTKKKITEINAVVQEWLNPIKAEVRNGSCILSNKVVLSSEINKKMAGINTVYVFCGHTLYLDEDVTLPGINLGIISPRWVFLKRVRFNLNGIDGSEHEENAKGSGKPGNPGSNGGDFLGVGDLNEDYLGVSVDGGGGGKGQNGAEGRDGVDYTRPQLPYNDVRCLIKMNTFRNTFKQLITRYKIFGASGCGSSGSDGGVGGEGGKAGVVTLINKSVKIVNGMNGKFGLPGKGGAGGLGGKDGCFFEVFDVDDEILHRISNVKCTPGNVLPDGKPGRDNWNRKGLEHAPEKLNLSVCDCIVNYIRHFQNPHAVSILKGINKYNASSECLIEQYNAYKKTNSIELYEFLRKIPETQPTSKILNSIFLARILILKPAINFYFIDYANYLNLIEVSVKNTNERTRKLEPVSYLKKKITVKGEKLSENLKMIKSKLINLGETDEFGTGKKITCVMLATIDVMFALINRPNIELIKKLSGLIKACLAPDEFILDGNTEIILPQNETFQVLFFETDDVGEYLQKLKYGLEYLKGSLELVGERRKVLEELVDELEHLVLLCNFFEWEESVEVVLKSLKELANITDGSEVMKALRRDLVDALIMIQYKLAEDAGRQQQYPFIKHDINLDLDNSTTLVDQVLSRIKHLQNLPNSSCKNEMEAYFGKNSAVGEFYSWSNAHIRSELEALFTGAEVRLKSSLINRHALDKSFIRFKSLKLEFESRDEERGQLLRDILHDYKMVMTHSGYSYYNWLGEAVVVVSEEMTFDYSFKTRQNGEPELYNVLYKKVQDGTITLSPYTSYTIRLAPVNERANYHDLMPFKNEVSLKLTGIGTFIP